jgi:ubiquinone biosynthesis protein
LSPFRFLRNFHRTRQIATILLNHGFGDIVERLRLMRYLRWWRRVVLRKPESPAALTIAERIRRALEELGPTFVKFGQVASTRPDLVPASIIAELEKLQEHVPPFSGEEAVRIVESELGQPVEKLFARFDRTPLAAGSLGQVHQALHFDGRELAVKIRRPNVVRDVERDLSLMIELAGLIERNFPEAEIFDPVGLVAQFARSIRRELHFSREARTMDEFRRLFRNDATLHIPAVCPELSGEAVLTMEFLDGIRISDRQGVLLAGFDPSEIAANGARIFLKMAFEFGLFHGDLHPGNIRILPNGVIGLLDYGMVGRLDDDKRDQLLQLLIALGEHNLKRCVDQVLKIGKPFRPVDRNLLTSDARDFLDGFYGLPLEQIDIGQLLSDFVSILATHGIRYPADLMLLIRAIVTLEGVASELDPGFNLAAHLQPVLAPILRDRYNPQRIAGRVLADARQMLGVMHDLPIHIGRSLEKLSQDDLRIHLEHQHLDRLIHELDRSSNRVVIGMVMSALIVASALVIRAAGINAWWVSVPTFILSSLLGAWLIYGIFRSGRL